MKQIEQELWDLENEDSGEYALHGLRLADLTERYWHLRRALEDPGSEREKDAVKNCQEFAKARARMVDKVRVDLLPKILKKLDDRHEEAARLRAIPRRPSLH
jgi:hypothetical protein